MLKDYENLKQFSSDLNTKTENLNKIVINVSMGTCGIAAGTQEVLIALKKEIDNKKVADKIKLVETGCMGLCHSEPSIEIISKNKISSTYGTVSLDQASFIIDSALEDKVDIDNLNYIEKTWYYPETEDKTDNSLQTKIVLKNSGRINPENIEEYLKVNGYQAMAKALTEMTPESIIEEITASGLRGRGGGGFPTGKKWQFAKNQNTDEKYIICNADEGDPGAFMDRAVLEGDPHAVIEAMIIAAFAIGANEGVVYIRAEYPLAIKRLKIAIEQATSYGLLGQNILNTGFDFKLKITYGAGAFVCGEETALMASVQGLRGMPNFKPPFPAIKGLWGKPTIVNNVETFANVTAIIRNGAPWFKKIGTKNSSGTKVFALAGKIKNVGLIEVPMGITLKKVIYDIGGGILDDKKFKAVQTGGPSGGCISNENIDISIDYDSLKTIGSMMGSGGMIVMDEDNCMVDVAKFFLDFSLDEACGKCTPCRIGGRQMFEILSRITKGNGKKEDIQLLKDLSHAMKTASLCGLGQTSPNPVLSTLNYFKNEYEEHINDKKCTSKCCAELITYTILEDKCIGCTLCARNCPVKCIDGKVKKPHYIDQDRCIRCGECYKACKFAAVTQN